MKRTARVNAVAVFLYYSIQISFLYPIPYLGRDFVGFRRSPLYYSINPIHEVYYEFRKISNYDSRHR